MSHFQIFTFCSVVILFILPAAFFSCAETGLMAANRYRLRHKARHKKRYAIRTLHLLKRPDRLLGAILIGNTFANMLASSLATLVAAHYWGDTGALIAAVLLTFIVLIFAEITPKTIAAIYPDKVARWVALPITFTIKLLYPAVWLANVVTNNLLRLLKINVGNQSVEPLSRDELRSIVYDTTGKISRQYQNMLLGILDLNKLTVEDVMIPRHEMLGIDISLPLEKILEQVTQQRKECIPFYREDMNQIVGVLSMHDMVILLMQDKIIDKVALEKNLKEPYFIPEGTSLHVQLSYFQQNQDKMAFVVDEYGEMLGALTLNDILEEIIGDFNLSLSVGKRIQLQPSGEYLVDGATMLREFNRSSGWELPLSGPRTLNGLITEYLEALPHPGTAILIAGYPIEIIQVKDNRVKTAKIFPRLAEKGIIE